MFGIETPSGDDEEFSTPDPAEERRDQSDNRARSPQKNSVPDEKQRKKRPKSSYGEADEHVRNSRSKQSQDDDSNYWPRTRVTMIGRLKETGNNTAWVEFIDLYGPLILRFCQSRLGPEDAEEVAQIVLLRLFRSLPNFEYSKEKGRFGGWIGKITQREIIRYRKKRDAKRSLGADSAEIPEWIEGGTCGEWEDEYHAWLLEVVMLRTRLSVTDEQWELFQLTWGDDRPAIEVAAEKGISAAKIHKARFVVGKWIRHHIRELTQDYISADDLLGPTSIP